MSQNLSSAAVVICALRVSIYLVANPDDSFPCEDVDHTLLGPPREKTCLWGFRQSEIQISLLNYRDQLEI